MFGSFVDYWYYTGDDTYNKITTQALVHQIGQPKAFMPPNQTSTLGNDDQAFWGMTALSAAENKFPDAEGEMSWLSLAIAVFNTQVPRWNNKTCGGGLNWQIFPFNKGFDYKNTISNGAFFNIAARLAKYTKNDTYTEWAKTAWEWEQSIGLVDKDYHFYDGSSEKQNCTEKNHIQWTYNAGIHMSGAAALWNMSEAQGNTVSIPPVPPKRRHQQSPPRKIRKNYHPLSPGFLLTKRRRKQPIGANIWTESLTISASSLARMVHQTS